MKKPLKNSVWLAVGVLALGLSARADVLLQNNTTDLLTRFSDGNFEFGNQIFLARPGYITNFSFEYYAGGAGGAGTSFAAGEHVDVTVRWYLQNGRFIFNGYTTPGTLIYSETARIEPTTRLTLDYSIVSGDFPSGGQPTGILFPVSRDLTWTVQFTGLSAGESAGVDLYSGAPYGSMYTSYWQNNGTVGSPSWELLVDATGRPITIGQEWMAGPTPEPSTLALSLVGGFGLLLAVRRFGHA
jgi:hypothetical protein